MPRVADSSALYALFERSDSHHRDAVAAVERMDPILVPSQALAETIDLIKRRAGWPAAQHAFTAILDLPHLRVVDGAHIEAVRQIYERGAGTLSLVDAYVIQTCRVHGAPALAYDQALLAAVGNE